MKKRNDLKRVAYFGLILILLLVFLISGLQILESTVLQDRPEQDTSSKKTIIRNGIEYFPKQDITVMLVMGIDQTGPVQDSGFYRNEGSADMVMLMIFDEKKEECNMLYLNRDTMLEMPVLGMNGQQAGTAYAQLALAHTYGNGLESSCENTKETVSKFLYGIQIDYYLSMNMDAISIVNDAVGGVTVTVTEDFSAVDPSIPMGEVTLRGEQAMHYVRNRKGVGDQLNLSRIERQKNYMESFLKTLEDSTQKDAELLAKTYDEVAPYLVSDCSLNTISNMLSRYEGYKWGQIVTPAGKNVKGEEYYEFHVDEEALDTMILELFYQKK